MLVTNIFCLSHNVFNPSKDRISSYKEFLPHNCFNSFFSQCCDKELNAYFSEKRVSVSNKDFRVLKLGCSFESSLSAKNKLYNLEAIAIQVLQVGNCGLEKIP